MQVEAILYGQAVVMKRFSGLVLFLWMTMAGMAQQKVMYSGFVQNQEGTPIGYATVLLSALTSDGQEGIVADSLGFFQLAIIPGFYEVHLRSVGYESLLCQLEIQAMQCDTFVMQDSQTSLKEVVVHARAVERKADRFVWQIPSGLNQNGIDLLRQAPGVWVSDGKIAINGTSGTRVFVNDREVRLDGTLLMSYLQSLRSENIQRIEVVPMAGADEDAVVQGGAIYIWLRQMKEKGWQVNASMSSSLSSGFQQYEPHVTWNRNQGKWNWYGTLSMVYQPKADGILGGNRIYADGRKSFTSEGVFQDSSDYEMLQNGLVYTPDNKTNVGIEVEYIRRYSSRLMQSRSLLEAEEGWMESLGDYRQIDRYQMVTGSVSFRHKLDTLGSAWHVLADYTQKRSNGDNQYDICWQYPSGMSDSIYRTQSWMDYRIASLDAGWKWFRGKTNYGQAGLKYTFTQMKDKAGSDGWSETSSWIPIPAYDYALDYHEHIMALYAQYAFDWKSLSLKAGLRGEYSQTSDRTNVLRRSYWDFFPHVDVTYAFDKLRRRMLVGQYARYIERPAFSALNPNRIQTSDYHYQIGNPALKPMYTDRLNLTFVYDYRYTLTIGCNLNHDLIRQFTKQDPVNPDVSFVTYENHDRENHWFVALNIPWQPVYWFSWNSNWVGVRQDIRVYAGNRFQTHYLYFGNATASFFLPWDIRLDLQYTGSSRLYSGNSEVNPRHTFDLRCQKHWGDRWSVEMSIDNIFNQFPGYVARLDDYIHVTDYYAKSSGRLFKIAISWNFNAGRKMNKVMVEKDSSTERERLTKQY